MGNQRTVPFPISQDNQTAAILLAAIVAVAAWLVCYLASWGLVNLAQGGQFAGGAAGALHQVIPFSQGTEIYFDAMRRILPAWLVALADWFPRVAAGAIGVGAYLFFKKSFQASFEDRHLRGRRVLEGQEALAAWRRADPEADGIKPLPSLPVITLARETRHMLVFGGVGSGKTQTIFPLMRAVLARGDRALVFDLKGDFTSSLPNHPGALLVPWDSRSKVWDVARDVMSLTAAREFAARMIVEPGGSGSPMWSNAARQILVSSLVELQAEQPRRWGFADLVAKITRPVEQLTDAARKHFPEAVKALGDGQHQNVTTAGIQINLMSYLSVLFDLARAWPVPPAAGRGLSIHEWIAGNDKHQTVILQHNGQFESLARAFNGAILGLASQLINSPLVGESSTRRLWFFLDEFPQLGKVEAVFPLCEIGRSKGVRVVIGVQDVSQLRKIYGNDQTDALVSMVGTHVVARVSAGETADHICKNLIGDREIERPELSTSGGAGQRISRTSTTRIVREPVMLPAELAKLGPTRTGVRVMWLGLGQDALITELPYTRVQKLRAASVVAEWTQHPAQPPSPRAETPAKTVTSQAQVVSGLKTNAEPDDTASPLNPVSAPEPQTGGMDFLDDFIGLKKTDIDGDEAGEGEDPPQSSLKTNEDAAHTEVSENSVSNPEPSKIIVTPSASAPISAATEAAKEGLAEPLEKTATHAIAEVLPDPLGLLIQVGEVLGDVQDAASAAQAPEVQVIPGGQEQSAGDKKKRRLKKKIEIEAAEQQP